MVILPVHGSKAQRTKMQKLADLCHVQSVLVSNDERVEIAGSELKICPQTQKTAWLGETLVFSNGDLQDGVVQIWKLGENDVPLEKIVEYENAKKQKFPCVMAADKNKKGRRRKQNRIFPNPKIGREK